MEAVRQSIQYTYVVDHGARPPRVGLRTKVLGGDVIVVASGDLVARLEQAEQLLEKAWDLLADHPLYGEVQDFLEHK